MLRTPGQVAMLQAPIWSATIDTRTSERSGNEDRRIRRREQADSFLSPFGSYVATLPCVSMLMASSSAALTPPQKSVPSGSCLVSGGKPTNLLMKLITTCALSASPPSTYANHASWTHLVPHQIILRLQDPMVLIRKRQELTLHAPSLQHIKRRQPIRHGNSIILLTMNH